MIRKKKNLITRGLFLILAICGSFGPRELAAQSCPTEWEWDFGRRVERGIQAGAAGLSFEVGLFLGWTLDATVKGNVTNDSSQNEICVDYTGAPGGTFGMDMGLEVVAEICAKYDLPFPVPDIDFCADVPGIPTADFRITDRENFASLVLGEERSLSDSLVNKCVSANFSPIPGVPAGLELCGDGNLGFILRGNNVQNTCGRYTGACVSCPELCQTVSSTWNGDIRPTGSLRFRPCAFVDPPILPRQNVCVPAAVTVPLPIPGRTDLRLSGNRSCDLSSRPCSECGEPIAECRQEGAACRDRCVEGCLEGCQQSRQRCRADCDRLPIFQRPICLARCAAEFTACTANCFRQSAVCVDGCNQTERRCIAAAIASCLNGGDFIRGDCNDDGVVDISDGSYLLNWLFLGGPPLPCLAAGDPNVDGGVDISDASYLLNFLFLGGPPPASPFPACGPGERPTDETLGCEAPTACAQSA